MCLHLFGWSVVVSVVLFEIYLREFMWRWGFFALLQWKLCVRLYRLFIRVVCGVWKGFSHSILPDVSFFGCVTCLGKIWKSVLSFCDMTEQKIIKEFSSVFPVGGKRLKVFFFKVQVNLYGNFMEAPVDIWRSIIGITSICLKQTMITFSENRIFRC